MFTVRKDRADRRDVVRSFSKDTVRTKVDLRPWATPIETQLHLGSCVGQAVVGAYELMMNKKCNGYVDLSRLFVYYNARVLDNAVDEDVGSYVRDGVKSISKWGVCMENIWPYVIDKFATAPSIDAYDEAKQRIITRYYRLLTIQDMVQAMDNEYPVVTSMNVYNSFYDLAEPGEILLKMPMKSDDVIGGHAVVFVGYDADNRTFIARNSFGLDWGDNGYFYVPFDYAKVDFMDSWIFDITC